MRLAHVLHARSCLPARSGINRIIKHNLGRYEAIASYFTNASDSGVTVTEDQRLKQFQDAKRKRRTEWKRRQGVRAVLLVHGYGNLTAYFVGSNLS